MAFSISAKVTGDKELVRRLEGLVREVPKESKKALRSVGQRLILDPSQDRVPVKTGALKGSGRLRISTAESRGISIKISYGGSEAPYAVKVHEDLQAHHDNGQAKFLESVVLQNKNEVGPELAKDIDLRRGA